MISVKPIGGIVVRIDGFETSTILADELVPTNAKEGSLGLEWHYFRVDLEKDHWGQDCWIEWTVETDDGQIDRVESTTGGSATIVQNHLFFEPIQSSSKDQ